MQMPCRFIHSASHFLMCARPRGFEFRPNRSADFDRQLPLISAANAAKAGYNVLILLSGAPEGIRTPDLCLRRAALYPAELRAREGLDSGTPAMRQRLAVEKKPIEGRESGLDRMESLLFVLMISSRAAPSARLRASSTRYGA